MIVNKGFQTVSWTKEAAEEGIILDEQFSKWFEILQIKRLTVKVIQRVIDNENNH